jgi:thiol-disulfide isomerase/thioredoxin
MRRSTLAIAFTLFTITSMGQVKTGFNIGISVPDIRDSSVYLAYHFGNKQYIRDTITLDNKGNGVFSGKESLPQGIYLVVLPGKKYFEVLISENQKFTLSCNYKDYFNSLKFSNSPENTKFVDYEKKWSLMQEKASNLGKRIKDNRGNSDSLRILKADQDIQSQIMKSYLKSVVAENGNNLLSVLVKSIIPIDVPEFTIPSAYSNADSVKWVMNYNYNKDHFFDNIDFSDERLLRTPIFQARLDEFFTNVLIQSADSINRQVDKLLLKCQGDYKMYQFVAVYLFNHFRESEIMGHDAVMVKIADEIYLSGKADWVSKQFVDDLRKQVELLRHNLIGMKAENLVMDSYKGTYVALYDIEKEFTILYFWEPNCGHCKEATPKLKNYYDKAKNEGVEVFTVCTTTDKDAWSKYIEENELNWINGWDPERLTHFDYFYNVQSTPTIYILDRNKKIIAKRLSVEDIPSFIENYRKYFRK